MKSKLPKSKCYLAKSDWSADINVICAWAEMKPLDEATKRLFVCMLHGMKKFNIIFGYSWGCLLPCHCK